MSVIRPPDRNQAQTLVRRGGVFVARILVWQAHVWMWHETVIAVQPPHVRCRSRSGKHVLGESFSPFDPHATSDLLFLFASLASAAFVWLTQACSMSERISCSDVALRGSLLVFLEVPILVALSVKQLWGMPSHTRLG
jgi:hypothetical protein